MRCPNCDGYVVIEDYEDTEPFDCEHCELALELVIDEGSYCGAKQTSLCIASEI